MYHMTLQLNAKLMPMDRGDIYEDPIDEALQEAGLGETHGGGSLMGKDGEIDNIDVEIALKDNSEESINGLLQIIKEIAVPKGTKLYGENFQKEMGELEGLALYLNGADLSKEVYETSDVNHVVSQGERLLEGIGEFYSHWAGPKYTALYYYGTSFEEMNARLQPLIQEYPLCQQSKIKQIA